MALSIFVGMRKTRAVLFVICAVFRLTQLHESISHGQQDDEHAHDAAPYDEAYRPRNAHQGQVEKPKNLCVYVCMVSRSLCWLLLLTDEMTRRARNHLLLAFI